MKEKNIERGNNILLIVTIVFIILKITGVISWSWFWVLSPMIFSWSVVIILYAIIGILAIIIKIKEKNIDNKKKL